ncbi:hypothetical protein [Paramicrobacterium fandaimingii]|uniref:hypothetical protein n=1 Tax=Paramicrobacterium fandaimingii TaxID=2708079 RepID=UPI001422CBB5|nr:hypothetical protein [Microbacterium fandaimingii]
MDRSRRSFSLDQIDALLEEQSETEESVEIFGLNEISTFKMLEAHGAKYRFVNARFTGDLPGEHSIGIREATTVLGAFQEILSEVGAVLRRDSPQRGPLPARVLRATELRLSPTVAPGSVIFTLLPADDPTLSESADPTLSDALGQVFALFDKVECPVSSGINDPSEISTVLRKLGPRTARHLLRFATSLRVNGLNIDVGMAESGRHLTSSRLSRHGAKFLEGLAKDATSRTTEVELRGNIHTLSTAHKHKFDDDTVGRIVLFSGEDVTEVLHAAFERSRVSVHAEVTETINLATGSSRFVYRALSAAEIDG